VNMRVAYLINQYPKISHTFIRREIHALERLGVDVTRIAIRGWDAEVLDKEDKSEQLKTRYVLSGGPAALFSAALAMALFHPVRFSRALRISLRMSRRSDRPFYVHLIYLAEACRIQPWLSEYRIEHLHAHFGTNPAEVAMLTHSLGGPPWSFTVHGPEEFDRSQSIGLAEKIRRSAFVVAISSFGRSQLFRLIQHDLWPKIDVVRCGLDRDFFERVVTPPDTKCDFVCVGRLCEQKGQLLLLDAARLLLDRGVQFNLVLAGDGELRTELEALIDRHKLRDHVSITGWLSSTQIGEILVAARALVLPSFAEGLPVVIMEAMAMKLPVISTYVAGIPELVKNGQTGWLVAAGDAIALADAMEKCLGTPGDGLQSMGELGFEDVKQHHDIERETRLLAGLFSQHGLDNWKGKLF
jgi:colanic acid/amylovoran biosynthesis glycosyltransferase